MAGHICPDCSGTMELGFVTTPGVSQAVWHPGVPQRRKLLGLPTQIVALDPRQTHPLHTFRCPDCFLVRTYAVDLDRLGEAGFAVG